MNAYLDKPTRKRSQIVIAFSHRGKLYRFFPGISIESKNWKDGKARGEFAYVINEKILSIQKVIQEVIHDLDHLPDARKMILLIRKRVPKDQDANLDYVSDFFPYWIERKRKIYAKGFDRKYRTIMENLLAMNPLLKMSQINDQFLHEWTETLAAEGNLNNTIFGKLKKVKQMCREAAKYGIKIDPTFEDFRFQYNKVTPVFLTWPEVEALSAVRNPYTDAFVFRCYTGIRFSDMASLNPSMVDETRGKKYARIQIAKQKKAHTIYIPDYAFRIWEENGFKFPDKNAYTESDNLKQAAKKANLDRQVQYIRYTLQSQVKTIRPIHEMISTHMARRTFARRWYDRGGDLNLLREYLGHKSLTTTLNYIGLEAQEANEEAIRIFG